ncbi:MoaF-related domain-containing protein [Nguyenibacter vanlangensis]|uniref:MoaF-like domain-containing protein n=1 Tax=Nguyenibacter vanlangensis TaxID=1216886 RepID=A0A7Y7IUG0_9PROT|nr:hypothetical protein [Nguyenibacter vanlangensis]NVN10487.1 hypothetical protein [Nguyenibacter vanlangensis]
MTEQTTFPHAGKKYTIRFENGLEVTNAYSADGRTISVEFLSGDLLGTKMTVPFRWTELAGGNFLLSWQEDDKSTVVHCDNFEQKICRAFYTMMSGDFYVMTGEIL